MLYRYSCAVFYTKSLSLDSDQICLVEPKQVTEVKDGDKESDQVIDQVTWGQVMSQVIDHVISQAN